MINYINRIEELKREYFILKYSRDLDLRSKSSSFLSKTIGLDLVAVKPLSAPRGILHYVDFVYDNKKN